MRSDQGSYRYVPTEDDKRWLRTYKCIAIIGRAALSLAVFEGLIFQDLIWPFASFWRVFWSMLAVAISIGVGYGVSHLIIRLRGIRMEESIDFSYENKVRVPPAQLILSDLITALILCVLCYFAITMYEYSVYCGEGLVKEGVNYFSYLSTRQANSGRDRFLLMQICLSFGCSVVGSVGCWLRPARFDQILGFRAMFEQIPLLVVVIAVNAIASYDRSVSFLYMICLIVYTFCTAVVMNQLFVIRFSYTSPTCHADDALRLSGIGAVARLFGEAVKWTWLMLSALMVLIFPLRVFLYGRAAQMGQEGLSSKMFGFPVAGAPVFNVILFVLSIVTLLGVALYYLLRVRRSELLMSAERVRGWFRRLWMRLWLYLTMLPYTLLGKRKKGKKEKMPERKARMVYEDTVIRHKTREAVDSNISYHAFSRRLTSLSDRRLQYRYGYRVLVDCMIRKHIGITPHATPSEIAAVVREKTNLYRIDEITAIFERAAYAGELPPPTVGEVATLMELVRRELERERSV